MGVNVSEQPEQSQADANKATRKNREGSPAPELPAITAPQGRIQQLLDSFRTGLRELDWRIVLLYGVIAGTLYGCSETTFYVIAVYFGAVGIRKTRHAVPAGIVADLACPLAAVAICTAMFG